jgi:Effector-associated domain 7
MVCSTDMTQSHPPTRSTQALLDLLAQHFNAGELRGLCFALGIDYDDLPDEGKRAKARELILYAQRHNRLADLLAACRRLRPTAAWPAASAIGPGPGLHFLQQRGWLLAAGALALVVIGGLLVVGLGRTPTTSAVVRAAERDGDPVRGATIIIVTPQGQQSTVSDGSGVGQLRDIPQLAGAELIVLAEGYNTHNQSIDLRQLGPWPVVLTTRNDAFRSVLIRVIQPGQFQPIIGAEVVIVVDGTIYSGITDQNGIAPFELPFEEQTLAADVTVTAAGRQPTNQRISLQPDQLQDIQLD